MGAEEVERSLVIVMMVNGVLKAALVLLWSPIPSATSGLMEAALGAVCVVSPLIGDIAIRQPY